MKQLLSKLLNIQKAIDSIVKGEKGHNYSYAGQEEVLNTIRPLMNEQGLLLMQEVLEVENTRIDYKTGYGASQKDKSEILTSAKQRFTWIDVETGDKLEALFHANGMTGWEKGLGSALTYAERYFLLKFFHIPTPNDDPDAKQTPPEPTQPPQAPVQAPKLDPNVEISILACTTLEELERYYKGFNPEEQKLYNKLVTNQKSKLS